MSPTEIKILMQKYGIAPKKLFGQNFLISKGILDKIVASADLSKNDIVLEIGSGLGALTFKLAPLVRQIIAVEKDWALVNILKERLKERGVHNVQIIEGDILRITNKELRIINNYKLIANIPYYLTSALIRKFLESENNPLDSARGKPSKMILMIQKEVAQRICPYKYGQKMNLLALSVQFYADAKILFYVSKNNFWPAPKVDSAVIEIAPRAVARGADSELFFKIARAGFASKRKQLASNLAQLVIADPVGDFAKSGTKQSLCHCGEPLAASEAWRDPKERGNLNSQKEKIEKILQNIGLNPKTRAEDLKLEDWVILIKILKS